MAEGCADGLDSESGEREDACVKALGFPSETGSMWDIQALRRCQASI